MPGPSATGATPGAARLPGALIVACALTVGALRLVFIRERGSNWPPVAA